MEGSKGLGEKSAYSLLTTVIEAAEAEGNEDLVLDVSAVKQLEAYRRQRRYLEGQLHGSKAV